MEKSLKLRKTQLIEFLKSHNIHDQKLLKVMSDIPRELFVDVAYKSQSYENAALPIGSEQTISQPFIVAFMTQELQINDSHKVLEVGTGSGYQAAITASLCKRLFTIERHLPLLKTAEAIFAKLNIFNITTFFGDGMKGWLDQAPFDRIMVTAAARELPENLLEQLKDGGTLIVPIGKQDEEQFITKFTRKGDHYESQCLMPVKFVPLLSGIVHNS